MKIIAFPDLNSWFKIVTCESCLTSLEIEEADLFCIYRDKHLIYNKTLANGIVNFYCTCDNCKGRVSVEEVPKLIQKRVAVRYPPPVRVKKSWLKTLFGF